MEWRNGLVAGMGWLNVGNDVVHAPIRAIPFLHAHHAVHSIPSIPPIPSLPAMDLTVFSSSDS